MDDCNDDFVQMLEEAKQLSCSSELHVKASEGDLPSIIEMIGNGYKLL